PPGASACRPGASALAAAPRRPHTSCAVRAAGTTAARPSTPTDRLSPSLPSRPRVMLPVAVDAMGGDRAPGEVLAGARRAVAELDIAGLMVGPGAVLAASLDGLPHLEAGEVIGMDEDPAQAVRRKKDSSLVRAAEAVRDGH